MQDVRRAAGILFLIASFGAPCLTSAAEHQFRLKMPDAQSVAVVGEFNHWTARPMTKDRDGTWTVTISLPPGTHGYKFLVNGTDWILDPENPLRKSARGVENSAISASDAAPAAPPIAETQLSRTSSLTPSPTRRRTSSQPTRTHPAAAAAALAMRLGEVVVVEVPLSPMRQTAARRDGNAPAVTAKLALGVPGNFDPAGSWPVLIINGTAAAASIEELGAYREAALHAGWVVLAAEGEAPPLHDTNSWRLAMIGGALDYLAQQWPGSTAWPMAAAGFGNGAQRSGDITAGLVRDGRKVIGMLLSGCGEDTASRAAQKNRASAAAFRQVPIFLSGGRNDPIARAEKQEAVFQSLKASEFRHVRLESFAGGHEIYPPHVREALRWFLSQR